MTSSYLSPLGLAFAGAAVLLQAGALLWIETGLSRTTVIAVMRATAQLALLGWGLKFLFAAQSFGVTLAALAVMMLAATHAALGRVKARYRGIGWDAFLSLALGAGMFCFYSGALVLEPGAWRKPSVLLPFTSFLLGNALSGISLGLSYWMEQLKLRRESIEFWLAHGATRWEAARPIFRSGLSHALTPILNSMSVAGLVSIPGMMSGQLLAGADPRAAMTYQIAALLLISTTTFAGTVIAMWLGFRRLFNERNQFRHDLIVEHKA